MINVNRNNYVGCRRRGKYGSILNVSNCENNSYTTFANGTPTGFDVTSDGGGTHSAGTADETAFINTRMYLIEFILVLNGGQEPRVNLRDALAGSQISVEGNQVSAAGSNVFVFTSTSTTTGVVQFHNSTAITDYEITNLSIRLIL